MLSLPIFSLIVFEVMMQKNTYFQHLNLCPAKIRRELYYYLFDMEIEL